MQSLHVDSWDFYQLVCSILHALQAGITAYKHILGATALSRATFGPGTGQIWLDNVACAGTESRLIECTANNIGTHNCVHSEDAGVRCTEPTSELAIKLHFLTVSCDFFF